MRTCEFRSCAVTAHQCTVFALNIRALVARVAERVLQPEVAQVHPVREVAMKRHSVALPATGRAARQSQTLRQ